jgi:hypothetical protein
MEYKTVRECLHNTVHQNKKPLKVIAEELDMTANKLDRYALPDKEEAGENASGYGFPLTKLIPLIKITNDFSVLDAIEHAVGRCGVLLPPPDGTPAADICRLTMKSMSEFGELVERVEQAIADDEIKSKECAEIIKEGNHAIQAILSLMIACKGKKL